MAKSYWRDVFSVIDLPLLAVVVVLQIFGIAVLFSFSFGGQQNLWLQQLLFFILGLGVLAGLTLYDYRSFKTLAWPLFGFGIASLLLVRFFGADIFGARRWFAIGFFRFQPSELVKLIEILLLARILSGWQEKTARHFVILLLALLAFWGLIMLQPDLGTTIILILVAAVMIVATRLKRWQWLALTVLLVIGLPLLWFSLASYQHQRLITFFEPSKDPSGAGYNVTQSLIAIGSGGLYGRGLGQGSQSQLNFLPAAHTDFIFAASAEATGFIGSILIIVLLGVLIFRIIRLASIVEDGYAAYIAIGVAALFFWQALINISGNLGLAPVTGIPLPFISFGGTATITYCAAVGILQSIYSHQKKIRF